MNKIEVGKQVKMTTGTHAGTVGTVVSVSPTLGRAVVSFSDGTILHSPVDYLDEVDAIQDKEMGYEQWLNSLPDPVEWLHYQISEYSSRFDGVNLLDAYNKDDDFTTLVMLRNTLAALKSARSNEEYYKRELQNERSQNSWAKNPDRMGQ